MAQELFANNALTTLASGITNVQTTITVADGSAMPSPTGGDYFRLVLTQAATETLWEVVKVTARSGNTLTVTRGQDGTTARAWSSGDKAECRLSAGSLSDFAQEGGADFTGSVSVLDCSFSIKGSSDATKIARFEVDGFTTGTTRTFTLPDASVVVSGSASALTSGRIPAATTGGLLTDTFLATSVSGNTATFAGAMGAARIFTLPDASITVAGSASALTSGRVPYATTGGLLTDTANYLFDGSKLTLAAATGTTLAVSSTQESTSTTSGCATFAGGIGVVGTSTFGATTTWTLSPNNLSGTYTGRTMTATTNPASSSSAAFIGDSILVQTWSSNAQNHTGSITAGRYTAQHNGSGTCALVVGATYRAYGASTTATATAARAINLYYGQAISGGTTVSATGVYINAPDLTGTLTNAYGIYIENVSGAGTLNYAIYTNAGIVRIGDTLACAASQTFDGQAARSISQNRHTTSNTAGNNLTINAGGATSGATDKDGGMLVLAPGLSTGTGKASVRIQGLTRAASTATSDNSLVDRIICPARKNLTNNTATSLFDVTVAANTCGSGFVTYAVHVFDGTDVQVHVGAMQYLIANKGGTITTDFTHVAGVNSLEKDLVTSGTITDTWSVVAGTGKATVKLNANSSLTPTVLYIDYIIHNTSGATITQL